MDMIFRHSQQQRTEANAPFYIFLSSPALLSLSLYPLVSAASHRFDLDLVARRRLCRMFLIPKYPLNRT